MKSSIEYDYTSLIALDAMINNSMKTIRGKKVLLSCDVAKIYHVSPDYLHKQVIKNINRFPKEFMFKLNLKELALYKDEKFPYVFTEKGILMVGGSLKNEQAIKIHVQLIRYFFVLFNQALKDVSLSEKLKNVTGGEEIFDVLKKMSKK